MKEYLSQHVIDTTAAFLYRVQDTGSYSVPHLNRHLTHIFGDNGYQGVRQFRGIYNNPVDGFFTVAAGFSCDPKYPSDFFDRKFMDFFYKQADHLNPEFICIVSTVRYLEKCAHTMDAQEALITLDDDDSYVVSARKSVQKIIRSMPILKPIDEGSQQTEAA